MQIGTFLICICAKENRPYLHKKSPLGVIPKGLLLLLYNVIINRVLQQPYEKHRLQQLE